MENNYINISPSTIAEINNIINVLKENEEYKGKIGNIEFIYDGKDEKRNIDYLIIRRLNNE